MKAELVVKVNNRKNIELKGTFILKKGGNSYLTSYVAAT